MEEHVKVERLKELNALVERKAKACSQHYLGRVEEVLAEGINPKDNTQLMGARTNRLTFFPRPPPRGRHGACANRAGARVFPQRVCPTPASAGTLSSPS